MGGTERLVFRLATDLAARGHHLTLRGGGAAGSHASIRFVGGAEAPPHADVAILVHTRPPPDLDAARVVEWSHFAQWPEERCGDAVVAVSEYHAGLLRSRLDGGSLVAIPAGVALPPVDDVQRDRFLYASSPDRGLHRLLAMWPVLWERFRTPLAIAYDVRGVFARRLRQPDALGQRLRLVHSMLDQPGILPQAYLTEAELDRLRARSKALLYPLDPVVPSSELYALSVLEACAAGCPPVLAPVDCFPSEYAPVARFVEPDGPVYDPAAWLAATEDVLSNREERASACRDFAAGRPRAAVTDRWEALLSEVVGRVRPARAPGGEDYVVWAHIDGEADARLLDVVLRAATDAGHRVTFLHEGTAPPCSDLWESLGASEDEPLGRIRTRRVDRLVVWGAERLGGRLSHLRFLEERTTVTILAEAVSPGWWANPAMGRVDQVLIGLPTPVWGATMGGESRVKGTLTALGDRVRCVGWWPSAPAGNGVSSRRVLLAVDRATPLPADLARSLSATLESLAVDRMGAVEVIEPAELMLHLDRQTSLVVTNDRSVLHRAGAADVPVVLVGENLGLLAPACALSGFSAHVPVAVAQEALVTAMRAQARQRQLCVTGDGAKRAVALIREAKRPTMGRAWSPPELRP